jgi:hypothetical protein
MKAAYFDFEVVRWLATAGFIGFLSTGSTAAAVMVRPCGFDFEAFVKSRLITSRSSNVYCVVTGFRLVFVLSFRLMTLDVRSECPYLPVFTILSKYGS